VVKIENDEDKDDGATTSSLGGIAAVNLPCGSRLAGFARVATVDTRGKARLVVAGW
jgi:hypothetical protein